MDKVNFNGQPSVATLEERENETSSFTLFLQFIRRFIVLIVICTVIGAAAGSGLALVRDKKVYTQSKSLVVVAKIDNSSVTTNISLTEKWWGTLQNTIKSPIFIKKANEVYVSGGGTDGRISANSVGVKAGDGLILTVSYSDYDEKAAADKLDAFIRAASEEIQSPEGHYVTADSVEFKPIDNVPKTSVSNGFVKYVLLGIFGGLVLGFAIAFLIYLFDNTVSNRSELERLTGAAVVAYIDDVA